MSKTLFGDLQPAHHPGDFLDPHGFLQKSNLGVGNVIAGDLCHMKMLRTKGGYLRKMRDTEHLVRGGQVV